MRKCGMDCGRIVEEESMTEFDGVMMCAECYDEICRLERMSEGD